MGLCSKSALIIDLQDARSCKHNNEPLHLSLLWRMAFASNMATARAGALRQFDFHHVHRIVTLLAADHVLWWQSSELRSISDRITIAAALVAYSSIQGSSSTW